MIDIYMDVPYYFAVVDVTKQTLLRLRKEMNEHHDHDKASIQGVEYDIEELVKEVCIIFLGLLKVS